MVVARITPPRLAPRGPNLGRASRGATRAATGTRCKRRFSSTAKPRTRRSRREPPRDPTRSPPSRAFAEEWTLRPNLSSGRLRAPRRRSDRRSHPASRGFPLTRGDAILVVAFAVPFESHRVRVLRARARKGRLLAATVASNSVIMIFPRGCFLALWRHLLAGGIGEFYFLLGLLPIIPTRLPATPRHTILKSSSESSSSSSSSSSPSSESSSAT